MVAIGLLVIYFSLLQRGKAIGGNTDEVIKALDLRERKKKLAHDIDWLNRTIADKKQRPDDKFINLQLLRSIHAANWFLKEESQGEAAAAALCQEKGEDIDKAECLRKRLVDLFDGKYRD